MKLFPAGDHAQYFVSVEENAKTHNEHFAEFVLSSDANSDQIGTVALSVSFLACPLHIVVHEIVHAAQYFVGEYTPKKHLRNQEYIVEAIAHCVDDMVKQYMEFLDEKRNETLLNGNPPSNETELIAEALRLFNDGESGEALKEFRRYFGLPARYVCECGYSSHRSDLPAFCPECGLELKVKVVHVKDCPADVQRRKAFQIEFDLKTVEARLRLCEERENQFWEHLRNAYNIETREELEELALGWNPPNALTVALHHIWKREPKVVAAFPDTEYATVDKSELERLVRADAYNRVFGAGRSKDNNRTHEEVEKDTWSKLLAPSGATDT